MQLTPEALETLLDMPEKTFIHFLADYVAFAPDDEVDYTLLYHPALLKRMADIGQTSPELLLGVIAPTFRRNRMLWYPDFLAEVKKAGQQRPYDPFAWAQASEILARPPLTVRWLVPGLIADGLTLLGGTPKSGKSYLAYTLAVAVAATGQWAGHFETDIGPVLFVSLEDDEDDTRARLAEIDPEMSIPLNRLMFIHGQDAIPRFDGGILPWLEEAMLHHQPRLLIIDPVSYLYALHRGKELFEETKDMLFPLRWLGKKHGCAIVCLDHRRKRSREDVSVFDTLYGSQAKIAVADSLLMVERDKSTVTMSTLLRRGKDQTLFFDVTFDAGRVWVTYKGEGEDETHTTSTYSDTRMQIMRVLAEQTDALTLRQIRLAIDLPDTQEVRDLLWQMLQRMLKAGEAVKVGRDQYRARA